MKLGKIGEIRGGLRSVHAAVFAGLLAAGLAAKAETYYYAGISNSDSTVLKVPAMWTNSTGDVATDFSLSDTYALGSSSVNQIATPNKEDFTFAGGEIQLGTRAAGTLNLNAGSLYVPLLTLGPGEGVTLSYGGANTTNRIGGRISVETASVTVRWAASSSVNRSGQVQIYDATLVGGSSAKIMTQVRYPNLSKKGSLVLAGDCSGYFGSIVVSRKQNSPTPLLDASWPDYWARLELATDGFNMPAGVEINEDCILESSAPTAILRALKLYPAGRLKIHSHALGSGLFVTNSVTLTATDAGANILEVVTERRVGHLSTNVYPLFTVPLASRIPWERFSLIGGNGRPFPVPDSCLAVTTNATAGTETLSLVEPPVVKLEVSDTYAKEIKPGSGADPSSALDKAASWSDNDTPHRGAHYLLEGPVSGASSKNHTAFRTRNEYTDQTFDGDSLTLGDFCTLFVFASKFSVPRLRLLDGSHLCNGGTVGNGKTAEIDAPVEVPIGCVAHIGPYSQGHLVLTGSVSGGGDMLVEGSIISTSYRQGFLQLAGDNSDFLGRITVRQYYSQNASSVNEGQYLEFTAANNLGGTLPAFDAEALTVGRLSALTPLTNVTLDASSNRGLYMTDSGAVNVTNAGTTLTVNWPLKVNGTMEKWGPGTLALGGTLTTNGACRLEVRQGAIQPLAQDALNGLTLSFAAGGTLLFDLANLPANGMRNLVETPFEFGEGVDTLPIEVKGDRTQALASVISAPLLTVDSAAVSAADLRTMLPDPPHPYLGCKSEWTVEEDAVAGTVTLGLTLTPRGTTIYMR